MLYEEPLKSNKMSGKISSVSLEPASNGVILSWTEKTEKKNPKNTYDNCDYSYQKEVYDGEEGAEDSMDSAFESAMPRFKELWKAQYAK